MPTRPKYRHVLDMETDATKQEDRTVNMRLHAPLIGNPGKSHWLRVEWHEVGFRYYLDVGRKVKKLTADEAQHMINNEWSNV